MAKSISAKMGIREGSRTIFINASADALRDIHPTIIKVATKLAGNFDLIHFFAETQKQLRNKFKSLKNHLKPDGVLWISWPKASQRNTDLNLAKVIEIGYDNRLVESKTLSINTEWSAIKFTHPKRGKVYRNSYGKLSGSRDR